MRKTCAAIVLLGLAGLVSGCSSSSAPTPPADDNPSTPSDPAVLLFNAGDSPWVSDVSEDGSGNILIAGEENTINIFAVKLTASGVQTWNKYYTSGTIDVRVNRIFPEASGYLVAGSLNNESGSLFKMPLDVDGNASSATYYDCGGFLDSISNDAVRLSDGTVVYAGFSDRAGDCTTIIDYGNALMTGISSAGLQLYRSSYNYSAGYSESYNAITGLRGGGLACGGYAQVYDAGEGYSGPEQAILVKYSSGAVSWVKNFGYQSDDGGNAGIRGVVEASDFGFALLLWSGYTHKMYVIKTNSAGDFVWALNVGEGNSAYIGNEIIEAADAGFVIAGTGFAEGNQKGAVIKISSTGTKLWEYNSDYVPTAICKTADGGYVTAGSVYLGESGYKIFAFKMDDSGKRVW